MNIDISGNSFERNGMSMRTLLLGDLSGLGMDQVLKRVSEEFRVERAELSKLEFLIAQINEECYDGEAYFLVRNLETGRLYEVIGSHCSCMGFEDQWKPEITSKEYLLSENYRMRSFPEIKQVVTELFA
jgi:hypothetical protein